MGKPTLRSKEQEIELNKTEKFVLLVLFPFLFIMFGAFNLLNWNFVTSFIALFLGLLGIFQDQIKGHFIYPKLRIELKAEPPASHKTATKFRLSNEMLREYPSYYFRLKIINEGQIRAENVEVMILEKHVKEEQGYKEDRGFLPLNLKWSHGSEITKKTIAPSLFKYCDFGHIPHPNYSHLEGSDANLVRLFFDFEVLPNTGSFILVPGEYKFKLAVSLDGARPIFKYFTIIFPDFWTEDEKEMLKAIVISEV